MDERNKQIAAIGVTLVTTGPQTRTDPSRAAGGLEQELPDNASRT